MSGLLSLIASLLASPIPQRIFNKNGAFCVVMVSSCIDGVDKSVSYSFVSPPRDLYNFFIFGRSIIPAEVIRGTVLPRAILVVIPFSGVTSSCASQAICFVVNTVNGRKIRNRMRICWSDIYRTRRHTITTRTLKRETNFLLINNVLPVFFIRRLFLLNRYLFWCSFSVCCKEVFYLRLVKFL